MKLLTNPPLIPHNSGSRPNRLFLGTLWSARSQARSEGLDGLVLVILLLADVLSLARSLACAVAVADKSLHG